MCAGAGTTVSSRFSVNSSNHSRGSRTRTTESRLSSLFLFLFWVNLASFLVPDRHFALVLDLKMYLMSPAVSMLRINWYQDLTRIQGQQEVRHFPSRIESSSLV